MNSPAVEAEAVIRSGELVSARYRVVRVVGGGGMGMVYEAVDERLGVRVALKQSCAKEIELKKQFEREARLLASLKHDALPKVVDYFIENNSAFLVMEFVDGVSLSEVVKNENGPLPVQRVIALADQVLDVLVYLHDQGRRVVHRDIKPQNIRLTSEGRISLLDFGLAKTGARNDRVDDDCDDRSVHGYSRRYSPIEQIRDSGTSERSDIYALGATLYFLLTGVRPEDAEKRAEVIEATGVECLRRADEVVPAVGEDLARIIERAMAVQSEERFLTATEFREALGRLGRIPVEEKKRSAGELRPRSLRRPVAIFASAVLLIGAVVVTASRFRKEVGVTESSSPTESVVRASADGTRSEEPQSPIVKAKATNAAPAKVARPAKERESKHETIVRNTPRVRNIPTSPRPEQRTKLPKARTSEPETRVAKTVRKGSKHEQGPSSEVMRAPDGTEVVRLKDGRLRVSSTGDRGVRQ